MPVLSSRTKPKLEPNREISRKSSKIIFLSCEGSVTEEGYFKQISKLYSKLKYKLQFVSVMQDIVEIPDRLRTLEQKTAISKSKPHQLVEKIENFKKEKNEKYEFDKHPEDEFWIVADVDDHTSDTYIATWEETLNKCDENGYKYAVSNPFFEIWLLVHHDETNDEDYKYAVTDSHRYEPTNHYRDRLRTMNASLKDGKKIRPNDYRKEKVKVAIERSKKMLEGEKARWPSNLGSTVYELLEEIVELDRLS